MTRRRLLTGGIVALLAGAAALFVHHVLYTPEGLRFVLRQLGGLDTVKIQVIGATGTLAGPLSADRIVVDHEAVHVDVRGVHLQLRPRHLLTGTVRIDGLDLARVDVTLKQREPQPPSETRFLPPGLSIDAPDFAIRDLSLTLKDGTRLGMQRGYGTLQMNRWRLRVAPFTLEGRPGQVAGDVLLRAADPLGLQGKVSGRWRLPDEHTYRFTAAVSGDLDRLATDFTLAEPAPLSFAGTLLDLTGNARAVGAIRMADWDGTPWVPSGTLPKLSGSVAIAASTRSTGLDGTLTSPSIEGGQVRVQGVGAWHESQLEVGELRVWLPRLQSELTTAGTIGFGDGSTRLDLHGEWTSLRWPLSGEATVQSPNGRYTLAGSMPYSFGAQATVLGAGIPEGSFDAAGSFDAERLVLDRLDGKFLDGAVSGSGRLAFGGTQAWRFDVQGRGLDIRKIRPEVTGRVNVAGSIDGQGFGATSPWTARIASLSGTLFGRALTGRGEVGYRDDTYQLRQVRIGNGASRVDVDGRWGRTVDLRWDADLRSLAIVAPGLAGELASRGRATGSSARPEITGEANARHVRYGSVEVGRAGLSIDVDGSDRRPSRVDLRADTLAVAGMRLESLHLSAAGLAREHDLRLDFSAPKNPERRLAEFHGTVAADGVLDTAARAWRGNLTEFTVVFPDGQSKLLQPAALELSPQLVRAAPICIATDESRLCVEGERQARPDSWRFIYSALDWPLRRLLRTLLGWREFDGRLQASGWAEQRPGTPWIGGTTLLVDRPTLDVPRNQFRSERLDLGGARLDVFVEREALRASVDLDLAANTRVQGAATAERRADILESPLRGTLHGQSAAMTSLSLFVPEIDRSAGSLDADVVIGGTVGEPTFDGTFHVRDGQLELYRTNLVLSKVSADGRFEGDELTLKAHGETAKGPVDIDGRFAWPDGVMTGTMQLKGERLLVADTPEYKVFASPDLTLRAGKSGFEVEGEIVVPTARFSPKDLSTSVGTSADERIVGAEEQDDGPSTLERVRSRIRVVLGDDVRVDSYGLKAKLGGELTVTTKPDDVARADGAIIVTEGQYKAFGQDVKITKGQIAYANAPLDAPQLELTAERYIKDADVTVTVNVRGTPAKPFVSITSTPAMSNNEALSYLLTGRSIDTLQSGEATSVNKAAENLAVSGGSFVLGSIGSRLGLDEVALERTGTNDTAVTIGKQLSPNLFVSYGVSIAEAINTIKLRYTLNKRWSLKAEAGLEQSADVEYKIER